MKYNLLGKTGLKVSEICMGTMTFGGKGYFKPIGTLGQEPIDALMKRAIDAGINFIDTANVYSEGLSEELTGKSIRNLGLHRDELVLATKVREKWVMDPTIVASPGNTSCSRQRKVCAVSRWIISICTRSIVMIH